MNSKNFHSITVGALVITSILAVNGCGPVKVYPTEVRGLAYEVLQEKTISPGDTREKVRSVLGTPFIQASGHPVEVYQQTGRDFQIVLPGVPIPVPGWGKKVFAFVLVAFDSNQIVTDLAAGTWSERMNFRIGAGGYRFTNTFVGEPGTLLGPVVPANKLVIDPSPAGKCTLVLVMGEWAMGRVSLNGEQVADFSPTGTAFADYSASSLCGTFLPMNLAAGRHRLNIEQRKQHSEFNVSFDCVSGETVYAELSAKAVKDLWWGTRLEGEILINKRLYKRLMDIGHLSPILWHRGKSYTVPNHGLTNGP